MDDYPDRTQRSSALPATNIGNVAVVRGSVIDVYFPQHLPHIRNLLRTGEQNHIILEVLTQLDAQRVRAIALTPTAGLARGMVVEDTGAPPDGSGRTQHPITHVRRLRQPHRPAAAP